MNPPSTGVMVALCAGTALVSYLLAGLNPSIILSKAIYHTDIRTCGSGNPGFTNFKRSFGSKYAWWVFFLDIAKSAVLFTLFGFLFLHFAGDRLLGVALSACFAMLGNAFPVWYRFKGGKGFMVCLTASWFLDWRVGLCGTAVMLLLLFTVKYMSLATMCGMASGAVVLWLLPTKSFLPPLLFSLCVLFMILRHWKNIGRLIKGTESKFSLKDKKK